MHQKVVDIWGIYLCHVWLCRDWELKCASRRLTWYDIGGLVSCRTTPCPFPPHTLTGPSAQIHHMWHWKNITRRYDRMLVCYTYDTLYIYIYILYWMHTVYCKFFAHTHTHERSPTHTQIISIIFRTYSIPIFYKSILISQIDFMSFQAHHQHPIISHPIVPLLRSQKGSAAARLHLDEGQTHLGQVALRRLQRGGLAVEWSYGGHGWVPGGGGVGCWKCQGVFDGKLGISPTKNLQMLFFGLNIWDFT